MSRQIEIIPGQVFMVAERSILVHETESVIADAQKIGQAEIKLAYLFTFKGRINNTDEQDSVTVIMSPEDAFDFAGTILDGIGLLLDQQKRDQ